MKEIEMLKILTFITFCLAVLVVSVKAQKEASETKVKQTSPQKVNQRPANTAPSDPFDKATVEMMKTQCVKLETEAGVIELEVYPESAPETVRSFLNLAATGAFDTTTFNRIVTGFVVQGGKLSTREKITEELAKRSRRTLPDEPNLIRHERGVLSMARPDAANSATTQFFILVDEASYLNGSYTAFGRVTKGMDVVDAINKMPVEDEKPIKPVRIKRATVAACPSPTKP
jgi:peptidyl-prolyl cis-trans isomerase B (cyclophilin B)